jgi:uncharacterized membrane protein YccC
MAIRLGRSQLRYCIKVGIAAGFGYLLTQGNLNQYSIYTAFAAALVVGTSVGEDLATSANRIKGTVVGMIAAMVTTAVFGPNWITVGLAAALTSAVALAGGWGIQVARVGVTVCIITLVAHSTNPLQYDLMRTLNTLIGVGIGLTVSFLIWPERGPEQVRLAMQAVTASSVRLLDAIDRGERPLRSHQGELHDALFAVVKAWRDWTREKKVARTAAVEEAQIETTLRLGIDVLACAMRELDTAAVQQLRQRINALSGHG